MPQVKKIYEDDNKDDDELDEDEKALLRIKNKQIVENFTKRETGIGLRSHQYGGGFTY